MFLQNPLLYKEYPPVETSAARGSCACRSTLHWASATLPFPTDKGPSQGCVLQSDTHSQPTPGEEGGQLRLLSNEIVCLSHKMGCHFRTYSYVLGTSDSVKEKIFTWKLTYLSMLLISPCFCCSDETEQQDAALKETPAALKLMVFRTSRNGWGTWKMYEIIKVIKTRLTEPVKSQSIMVYEWWNIF